MDGDLFGRAIYLGLLLAAVGGWVMVEYRGRMGQAARSAMAWGLIIVGLMAGYGLWNDIRRDVVPTQMENAEGIEIPQAEDGHYYMTLTVAGQSLRFMADTGATGVVLTREDAARVGIDLDGLVFTGVSSTANGTVRTARIRLPDVRFGPYLDESLGAWVNEGEMDISLLGMDYLRRFRIEIAGDMMILRR